MTGDILAFWTPGPLELLFILFVFAIPVVLIVLVVVYFATGNKKREKLHQKIDEVSGELKWTEEQLKAEKKSESSNKSE
jgi:uncharacterized membrane protein